MLMILVVLIVLSQKTNWYVIFTYKLIFVVPSTPPVNFTVDSLNSTAIQAEWNAPELIHQNGVLTSYQIRYNGLELDTTERSLNLSINTMSVILTGLLPNVYYCIIIRVENGAGLSEFSSPKCSRTHEAGKIYAE